MKKLILSVLVLLGVFSQPAVQATELGTCMVDSLNGKERKNLAKWIFFSMAAHPHIGSYSNISEEDLLENDKYVGQLVTRLLTKDCPDILAKMSKSDPLVVQKSFELVGQVAMQELMTDEKVVQTISNYAKYTDIEKIDELISK